jgi:DNA-binding beta-propeller fold protein YncE
VSGALTLALPSSAFAFPIGKYRVRLTVFSRASELSATIFERLPTPGVTTVAGGGPGYADGLGIAARFFGPAGVTLAPDGYLYVADRGNHRIRRVHTLNGIVTTLAGTGAAGFADGSGVSARFNHPAGIAAGRDGMVYVADASNHRIRRIALATGSVTTLAGDGTAGLVDGIGSAARFNYPTGIALGTDGKLYVADGANKSLRRIDPATGAVTTHATFSGATLDAAAAPDGAIYVTHVRNACPNCQPERNLTRIQPNGTKTDVNLLGYGYPAGLAVAHDGALYVSDQLDHRIWRVDPNTGAMTVFAGDGTAGPRDAAPGPVAQFMAPWGLAVAPDGTVFAADRDAGRIRRIRLAVF